MKITLKSLHIENFKGIKSLDVNFANKTTIRGQNATGKTSIFDAFTWLLFNKNSFGDEKFNIRPLGKDGNRIDNVEIKVTAILDVDGKIVELGKVQKQNWVKKRGTDMVSLQGNVNSFEIDGYPKSEADFKEYVSGLTRSEELFKLLTNPLYFSSLKWKDQRDILMKLVSDFSDVELARTDATYAPLIDELEKAPSTDDIRSKFSRALSEWKKRRAELPIRIDEAEKLKIDIDVSECELLKNSLKEQITDIGVKLTDTDKQSSEYQKLSVEIMNLKFAESDMIRKANEELIAKKKLIQDKIDQKNVSLMDISNRIQRNNRDICREKSNIDTCTNARNKLAETWKSVNSETFDESTTICPTCHRELPAEEIESLRRNFEELKEKRLATIEKDGLAVKADIDTSKMAIQSLEQQNEENLVSKGNLEKDIAELENQLSELPAEVDISDVAEYKEIRKQIEEKKNKLSQMNNADETRRTLNSQLSDLQKQLIECEKQIAMSQKNVEIDERIEDLRTEQREVGQKVADQEKMLYLLEDFIRFKLNKISCSINGHFKTVNFKLFETQLNGGMKDCCECTVNGVPYSTLNSGHRIVAGLDIISSLSDLYGANCPIFIDNAESLNDYNIPEMDCQLIKLKVSDENCLRIEVE